ncbi:MAG: DNA adenine methylase [Bacilli bacterium]|nr:DNA adenine methylase [Bacilli bacterium]
MKSPIKWMGGKSKSVKTILPLIPKHECYVEPFFGGGWIYFAKEPSKVEAVNDVNGELINFFEVLRTKKDEFISQFEFALKSRELYLHFRQNMDLDKLTDVERAFRFYYIIQNAFGGMYRMNKKGQCNAAFVSSPRKEAQGSFWDLEKINMAHERLKETIIENRDYKDLIKIYDKENTFFFFDPPYDTDLKYNGITIFDYDELLNTCKNLKGKFLLTLNGEMRDKFNEFNIVEHKVAHTINGWQGEDNNRSEIIVLNY